MKTVLDSFYSRCVVVACILFFLGAGLAAVADAGTIRINEVMASNRATIADEDGDYEDWIELYNYGLARVS